MREIRAARKRWTFAKASAALRPPDCDEGAATVSAVVIVGLFRH
jgi:hypothetical protein